MKSRHQWVLPKLTDVSADLGAISPLAKTVVVEVTNNDVCNGAALDLDCVRIFQ